MSSATNAVADGSAELPVDHVVVIWCEVAEICIMELFRSSKFALAIFVAFAPFKAASACDELVGTIITKHLGPAIEQADFPIPGMDKPGHKLVGVCYESAGPTSKIKIDTALNCHASGESVTSKLTGGDKALSKTENVSVEAEARGADCQLLNVEVKPSGELAKLAASWFDANGKARQALEQGLAEVCKK